MLSSLCINRDFFLLYKSGRLNFLGHDVPCSCSVNQNLTPIQLFSLLIELVLERVNVLSQEKKAFLFVHWCDATHPAAYSASRRLTAWLRRALTCRRSLKARGLIRIELLLAIWNGYRGELGISFIVWSVIERVELKAWSVKVLPKCWHTSFATFVCRLFRIMDRTICFTAFVSISENDTTRLLSNLTLLHFLNWSSFSWQELFQRSVLINFIILACNYIYWRCLTPIFNAYALGHDVHSLLIWNHWSPNFICINLLHILFASCYEYWVKLVVVLDKPLFITTTLLLPIISSSWWFT